MNWYLDVLNVNTASLLLHLIITWLNFISFLSEAAVKVFALGCAN